MNTDIKLEESEVVVEGDLKLVGPDFKFDCPSRRKQEGGYRRALVHDFDDALTINFGQDYPGGVKIQGAVSAPGLRLAEPFQMLAMSSLAIETHLYLDGIYVPLQVPLVAGKTYQVQVRIRHVGIVAGFGELSVKVYPKASTIEVGSSLLLFPGTLMPGQSSAIVAFAITAKADIPPQMRPQLVEYQLWATLIPRFSVTQMWPQNELPRPEIRASSPTFDNVAVGSQSEKMLTLESLGKEPLVITAISVTNGPNTEPGTFTLKTPFPLPRTINQGGKEKLTLVYAPKKNGAFQATIEIQSNDPLTPVLKVSLVGRCFAVVLSLDSESLDTVLDPPEGLKKILLFQPWLTNEGSEEAVITSMVVKESLNFVNFSVIPPVGSPTPLRIAPGAKVQLSVFMTRQSNMPLAPIYARLQISSQGPLLEVPITVEFNESPV